MKALALAVVLALAPVRARAAGEQMSATPEATSSIVITSEPALESARQKLELVARDELARISADLVDLPQPPRIEVRLVRDASELATIAPGRGAPPWAIGIAYPDIGLVGIALRRGSQVVDPASTLRHELGHIALGAALGNRAPHWLHEGFAYQHSAEWSWDRAETLAGMVWFGGVIPLDDLDQSFPADEAPANRAYAESYDFVGYLARRGRWEDTADDGDRWPFRNFLTAVGHGADLDTAATHAFGKPIHALFDEWRDEVMKRYLTAPVGLLGLLVWVLCAVLLTLAWMRRRRHNRRRLAQWDREERAHDEELARLRPVIVPPYVPWPGEDPFAESDDEPGDDPKLVN
jgi:peptidase MA superfamily protein